MISCSASWDSIEGKYSVNKVFGAENQSGGYEEGLGVPQDYKEAFKWFRLAAEQGFADGQCCLGDMYYEGEGVPHDYAEAIKWWKLAGRARA